MLGMKSMGNGLLLRATCDAHRVPALCHELPTSTVITGIDSLAILKQALNAVRTFKPLSKTQLAALLRKTSQAAAEGRYERFKTDTVFDATARHPEWLGSFRGWCKVWLASEPEA